MSCEFCVAGGPNCWPERVPCPDCKDGYVYELIDPDTTEYIPCTKEDYNKAAPEYREKSTCPTCKGEGWL